MFTANLEIFKTQQRELHRRAEHYRLVKSLEESRSPIASIYVSVGNALIVLGQSLLKHAQAAH